MENIFKMAGLHLQKISSGKRFAAIAVLFMLLTTPVFAYSNYGSTITISSWDHQPFVIEINHERYQSNGSFTLENVRPGKVRVRILRDKRLSRHMNYGKSGKGAILYNGFIDVPSNSRVRAKVDRNRRLRITNIQNLRYKNNTCAPDNPYDSGECGENDSGYGQIEHDIYEDPYAVIPYSYEQTSGYGGSCAMTRYEFDALINEVNNACFSSDQLRIAKQALRHQFVTSVQLEDLIRLVDFDSIRLELAKSAYCNVIDKENIWKVYDAFSFSSTAREFEEFIYQR